MRNKNYMQEAIAKISWRLKRLFHNKLGWAYPADLIQADKFQPVYKCKYCKGEIATDSTGQYFHFDDAWRVSK